MSYRPLELTLISAKDLDKVNLFSKMEVYAIAMIAGDPRSKKKTHTDRDGGRNPNWNATFNFNVMESDLERCVLQVVLKAEKAFGDREIGEVHVPVKELLSGWKKDVGVQYLSYQVRKPSGKAKGTLNFSYKFKEPMMVAAPPPPQGAAPALYPTQDTKPTKMAEPVTTYPVTGPSGSYSAPALYPSQDTKPSKKAEPVTAYPVTGPSESYSGYPPQPGYAYPPPHQSGYGQAAPTGYPPQQTGYGYPGQQAGYGYPPPPQQAGYGYPPPQQGGYYPPQQQQQGRKNKFGGAGLGLGAGLLGGALGGMIIGDMVSDAGSYDAGYDAGFDDAGFDF